MIAFICSVIDEPSDREYMLDLYDKYKRLMFSTAGKYIQGQTNCEDIVQDSIIKLIPKISVLRQKDNYVLSDYIETTVRNTAINYLKRENIVQFNDIDDESEAEQPTTEEYIIAQEKAQYIMEVLNSLSQTDRMLLEGKYILEYTDEELAEMLSCKPSSIRMKLTRARRRAIKLFEQKGTVNAYERKHT